MQNFLLHELSINYLFYGIAINIFVEEEEEEIS